MKRITVFALLIAMICSLFAVNSSAAILAHADFSDMVKLTETFHAGAFFTDDDTLLGYAEAKCLQSKGEWFVYDARIEVALADDELSEDKRSFHIVYPNTNLKNYGRIDDTYYMSFSYDFEADQFWLTGGGLGIDKTEIIAGPIDYSGIQDDGSEFYSFGISVNKGRMRCFFNDQLIFDCVDSNNKYLIGIEDESTYPTAHMFWNDGNFVQIRDITISTPEYLFPSSTPVNYGDANGDNKTNISDATAILKHLAKWDIEIDLAAADVKYDNKVNISDVTHLLKHLAKWEGIVLGPC